MQYYILKKLYSQKYHANSYYGFVEIFNLIKRMKGEEEMCKNYYGKRRGT